MKKNNDNIEKMFDMYQEQNLGNYSLECCASTHENEHDNIVTHPNYHHNAHDNAPNGNPYIML